MHDKTRRRPLIDPLLLALKSRRVIVALAALAVGALVTLIPDLAAVRAELLVLVITLALAVIGGYSVEDAAAAARQSPVPDDLRDQIRDALDALIDELLAARDEADDRGR